MQRSLSRLCAVWLQRLAPSLCGAHCYENANLSEVQQGQTVRSGIPLRSCLQHGFFDDAKLALVPSIVSGKWNIVSSSGDWTGRPSACANGKVRHARHDFQQMPTDQMPYRRVLADRYKDFIDKLRLHSGGCVYALGDCVRVDRRAK